ncbi:UNVERIFIED_CONTAM: hypothetical protein FKN15_018777 [Acipenser sinensis]
MHLGKRAAASVQGTPAGAMATLGTPGVGMVQSTLAATIRATARGTPVAAMHTMAPVSPAVTVQATPQGSPTAEEMQVARQGTPTEAAQVARWGTLDVQALDPLDVQALLLALETAGLSLWC